MKGAAGARHPALSPPKKKLKQNGGPEELRGSPGGVTGAAGRRLRASRELKSIFTLLKINEGK